MGTYLFLTLIFPVVGLDQLKCWFGLVNICLDWLVSIWIGYHQSRLVNISVDGLNIKKYWLISVRIG